MSQTKVLWAIINQLMKVIAELKKQLGVRKIKIRELAEAMATFEGFYLPTNPRAKRNNNPGNMKGSQWESGKDKDGFSIFPDIETGWKAFEWDLEMKTKGMTRTELTPESTIKDLIYTWSATDQQEYTDFVCGKLGISESFKLKNFVA
jgi:hypothetical protein